MTGEGVRRVGGVSAGRALRFALVSSLLLAGLLQQLYFFARFPQPPLFGDPAGYLGVGRTFQEAAGRLWAGEAVADVLDSVRGGLPFAGVGVLYGTLDALAREDLAFFRTVFAAFNTVGLLGCFLLARRLSGSFLGGIVALGLAAAHPSLSTHTGRLYPDPVTGCLFVWAAFLYAEALHRGSARLMAGAGLLLTCGLFVRSQLMTPTLVLVAFALASTAFAWARRPETRRLALSFVAGCIPLTVLWLFILSLAQPGATAKVAEDNFALRQLYPYGFWQFLETDGWEGPYRLKTEPFYKAMEAAARSDPDLLRSRSRQRAFTFRYVMDRAGESALLVLDNVNRLYDRPTNGYRWDYPFSYPWQVALQRGIVVLALAGLALFAAAKPALAAVFFMPATLAIVHGLAFPWPRYGLPALLTLTACAGAFVGGLAGRAREVLANRRVRTALLVVLCGGALALGLGHARAAHEAEAARVARCAGALALLAAPFLLSWRCASGWRRSVSVGAWLALALPVTAHAVRDRLWHTVQTRIGGRIHGVEQHIFPGTEGLDRLRSSSEAFLVLDLQIPRGDTRKLRLTVGDRVFPGSQLLPTMPSLPESTTTGGRDWRGYPQWWALPLDPALLPEPGAPLLVRLTTDPGAELTLGGDRFRGSDEWYEGPSFGDRPNVVALKLEYDGDYRLPVRRPLLSAATRSFVILPDGTRRPSSSVHRIRLVTLGQNEAHLRAASAAVPERNAALAFAAYSGRRGSAELVVDGEAAVTFPMGRLDDFVASSGAYTLCFRTQGLRGRKPFGTYFLAGPFGVGRGVELAVRFRSGMSVEPRYFIVDPKREALDLSRFPECGFPPETALVNGGARILDATRNQYPEDTGTWIVTGVL